MHQMNLASDLQLGFTVAGVLGDLLQVPIFSASSRNNPTASFRFWSALVLLPPRKETSSGCVPL